MPMTCQQGVTSEERVYARNVHAPYASRRFVRAVLGGWGLVHLIETTELIASELVTNAVQNSRGDSVGVRLESSGGSVLISVWDDSPERPVAGLPGFEDEGGRGLMITSALAEHWGSYRVRPVGKIVWALVPGTGMTPSHPGEDPS